MKINFKQPKYVLPLIALPFLCLFFYVYHSTAASGQKKRTKQPKAGLNSTVADIAPVIKKKKLEDKLDAYRNTYKGTDGSSAVYAIPTDQAPGQFPANVNSVRQRRMLDSINRLINQRYQATPRGPLPQTPSASPGARALTEALNNLQWQKQKTSYAQKDATAAKEKDPMEIFRQQMAFMDSVRKAADPAYQSEQQKKEAQAKVAAEKAAEKTLLVQKASGEHSDFNTVMPGKDAAFITAVIDENLTGYAGSRIKLRLLEDITAGKVLVKKGAYLYALINGFSQQRVTLQIKSILYDNQILPVKLDVYDTDGILGLYVPQSAFRDFTKDLSTNTVQGVTVDGSSSFLTSAASKMFESTSSAIAGLIRKNKVKLKYNSYIYLIDSEVLKQTQKTL